MKKNIARRLARLRTQLRRNRLDALLVSNEANVRYLSGFTGDSSALLITTQHALFITDFRYVEQAQLECPGYRILRRPRSMVAEIARAARRAGIATLGVEAQCLTLDSAQALREELAQPIRIVHTAGLVETLRAVKDPQEVAAINACIDIAQRCIQHARRFLVPGIQERDVAAEMEYFVRQHGADGMAFPTIVAFGPRGSLPHARAGEHRMKPKDPVLIDWGVRKDGYVCDLTRVFFHLKISPRFERIYRTALDAQRRAIRRIRPGVTAGAVDAAARNTIARAGWGPKFGHSLGHGIGLEVHEAPTIGHAADRVLKRGMLFTVEPGIYLPGLGGVRIEDDVLVTNQGVKVLSNSPKRLKDIILGG